MISILRRAWIPLVVVAAVALGGIGVIKLRDAFGSDEIFTKNDHRVEKIVQTNPKQVTYEVFGPSGTVGGVSYLDENAEPQHVDFSGLPWTYTLTTTLPVVVANVVAQGDGDSIGCRITVNGDVMDEQSTTGHHAQTFCLVKAA